MDIFGCFTFYILHLSVTAVMLNMMLTPISSLFTVYANFFIFYFLHSLKSGMITFDLLDNWMETNVKIYSFFINILHFTSTNANLYTQP